MVKLPHWPVPQERVFIRLSLESTLNLLDAVGNPHTKLPPVIHIAGTNGKGSTQAFLKYILNEAGYKVHTYTSPHLIRYNERINLCGNEIDDDFLYEMLEEVRFASEQNSLNTTFFEGTTVAAFLAFSKVPADFLILETGLGGEFDSTNVIENPLMTIITSISFDHTDKLGDDIRLISKAKAGIIKQNTPCVVAQQYEESFAVIEQTALEKNAELIAFEYDWFVAKKGKGLTYHSPNRTIEVPSLGLQGDHQLMNAGNAISAAINLKNYQISDEQICNGLAKTFWPSRLQKLASGNLIDKIPSNWEIVVDGAHNDAGALVVSNWIAENNDLPTYLIFGMSKKRDVGAFISYLKDQLKAIFVVGIEAEPLAYRSDEMHQFLNEANIDNTECESIEDAIEQICKLETNPARILICGSLYLAADAAFKNQNMRKL